MKKTKYSILRVVRPVGTRDPFRGGFHTLAAPRPAEPEEARVDVDELTVSNVRDLARDPAVAAIARVMPTRLIKPVEVTAAAAGPAWGISAVGAGTTTRTGAGVVVSVLDTGIDANHAAFQGVELVQQDFSGSGNGDVQGHGTHCAGTIFGRDVDGTRIGIAIWYPAERGTPASALTTLDYRLLTTARSLSAAERRTIEEDEINQQEGRE